MNFRVKLIVLPLIVFLLLGECTRKSSERRKIKLSELQTESIKERNEQEVTILKFEPEKQRSIAVLYFENKTGDPRLDWLRKGLAEMLITDLSQSRYLDVLSLERLYDIFKSLKKQVEQPKDIELAAAVAKEAHVQAVLTGNFVKEGDSLKIIVQLRETSTGNLLKEEQVTGPGLERIFTMVDDLTRKVKDGLKVTLKGTEEIDRRLADLTTTSLEAYRHFTQGMDYSDQFFVTEAVEQFRKALEIDSTFAKAYLKLAIAYLNLGEIEQARKAMNKAVKYSDRISERERFEIIIRKAALDSDLGIMKETYQKWIQQYPEDREANYWLANFYFSTQQYEKAIKYYENTIRLDPNYKMALNMLGYCYFNVGNLPKGIEVLERYRQLAPEEPNPEDSMGEGYQGAGEFEKAIQHYQSALKKKKDFHVSLEHLGTTYFDQGNYSQARKTFGKYLKIVPSDPLRSRAHGYIAETYWRENKLQKALREYQKGLKKNPLNILQTIRISEIYKEIGDTAQAKTMARKQFQVLKQRLQDKTSYEDTELYAMASLSIEQEVCLEETYQLMEKAGEKEVDNPINRLRNGLTRGILKYKLGHIAEAARILNENPLPVRLLEGILGPNRSGAWKYIAEIFSHLPEISEELILDCQDQIQQCLEIDNKSLEAGFRYLLALCYTRRDEDNKAAREYKTIGAPRENQWLVIGPFENQDGFNKIFPPETEIDLNAGYEGFQGEVRWRRPEDALEDGFIDFKEIFYPNRWSVAYGLIYVEVPTERAAQIRIGTDDGVKVWLNDEQVWRLNQRREVVIDDDIVTVLLKPGTNKILIKVCQRLGDWGFYFRITDPSGKAFDDLNYTQKITT